MEYHTTRPLFWQKRHVTVQIQGCFG